MASSLSPSTSPSAWRSLGFLLPYLRGTRWGLVGYIVLLVARAVMALTPPLAIRTIIDTAVESGQPPRLGVAVGVFFALTASTAGLGILGTWAGSTVSTRATSALRVDVFRRFSVDVPSHFFNHAQPGALAYRVNNDTATAQGLLTTSLATVVSSLLGVALPMAALAAMSWRVALGVAVCAPAGYVIASKFGAMTRRLAAEQFSANSSLAAYVVERLSASAIPVVRLAGRADDAVADFRRRSEAAAALSLRQNLLTSSYSLLTGLVGGLALSAVYLGAGLALIDGHLTVGTMVAMAAYAHQAITNLGSLTGTRVDVASACVAIGRIMDVVDAPEAPLPIHGAPALGYTVELSDVWYRYPSLSGLQSLTRQADATAQPAWVLRGVSLQCRTGTMTAIVGRTGAGKSTLLKLVAGLDVPTRGAVSVAHSSGATQRAPGVTYLPQETFLFHESLAWNLRVASPDATDDELWSALELAQLADIVRRMPDGLETMMGERGFRLSGGERQRLALARVVVAGSDLVLLDEATAHLDPLTEGRIQAAFDSVLEGRTSIVVAHRFSTIRRASHIVVLADGAIVQAGTFDDLRREPGAFSELVRADAG